MRDVPLLIYVSMQALGGRDHELWSNEHLPGIGSEPAGPYPAVNHADHVLPLTSYTNAMGHEEPPHVAIVSVHFISLHVPLLMRSCAEGP
jgi:hypothetical protein